ncbi:MAG: preprotein translocase subunit SecG [Spirochaetia bacterium]
MQFFGSLSLVIFITVAILLILLVLVQNDQGEGLGGLFSGNSASPFGGQGSNVLQKITGMLALLFFLSAATYGIIGRARYGIAPNIDTSFQENTTEKNWWGESENFQPADDGKNTIGPSGE